MFGRTPKPKQGIGLVGRQGPIGERGRMGDHGQHGDEGETGAQGEQGEQGERGRGLSLWQALAMFLFVVAVFVTLSIRTELQQRRIESQQRAIQVNTEKIIESRYQGCLGGLAILDKFNKQMEELAKIEETQTVDKVLAARRIKAYRAGQTLPLPQCTR